MGTRPSETSVYDRFRRLHSAEAELTRNPGTMRRLAGVPHPHLPSEWDHLPLSLVEVLWSRVFVYVPLALQAVHGLLRMVAVRALRRWGCLATPARDAAVLCCELLLETSCAVFVECGEGEGAFADGRARFAIPWAAKVVDGGDVQLGPLAGELDLRARRLVAATFDGAPLAPPDAFLLLWLALVGQNHPQVRAPAPPARRDRPRLASCLNHALVAT